MIYLYEIKALGYEPVAWSVPTVGTGVSKDGRRFRFARRPGKSDPMSGRVCLKDWQEFVRDSARVVVGRRDPETSPLSISFEFYAETPSGFCHGTLWDVRMEKNKKTGAWAKKSRNGRPEPDLSNLVKAAEDALSGVVYHDDCKNRILSAVGLYHPVPGLKIVVHRIEPSDHPGYGDPVP